MSARDEAREAFRAAGGYDPWEALGLLSAYDSEMDRDAIYVLEGILIGGGCSNIAAAIGLSDSHVQLLQHVFCRAGWADYGTAPRYCYPNHEEAVSIEDRIANWRRYYAVEWREDLAPTPQPVREASS